MIKLPKPSKKRSLISYMHYATDFLRNLPVKVNLQVPGEHGRIAQINIMRDEENERKRDPEKHS
jgi:hypothetical protein